MSRLTFLPLALFLLFASCKNTKKNAAEDNSTVIKEQPQDVSASAQKVMDELQKLTPLSIDQLNALMPDELTGFKKLNYNASNTTGAGLAHGEYSLNDSTSIEVNIYDCAGPGGAGIYSIQYIGMLDIKSETDEQYTRTIDFMNSKAFEHCKKKRNDCSLTYFTGNRFLVTLEGTNVNADGLKRAAKGLKLK
jgi:hypothetical protein